MSATYDDIRKVLDHLEAAGLPVPDVAAHFHEADDDLLATLVAAVPGRWTASSSGSTDWIHSARPGIRLVGFAKSLPPVRPSRTDALASLIESATAESAVAS